MIQPIMPSFGFKGNFRIGKNAGELTKIADQICTLDNSSLESAVCGLNELKDNLNKNTDDNAEGYIEFECKSVDSEYPFVLDAYHVLRVGVFLEDAVKNSYPAANLCTGIDGQKGSSQFKSEFKTNLDKITNSISNSVPKFLDKKEDKMIKRKQVIDRLV